MAPRKRTAGLTDRQREVLTLLVRGVPMREVGQRLGISRRTVAFHKYHSMRINGLQNNADLMRFALLHQLLPGAPHE